MTSLIPNEIAKDRIRNAWTHSRPVTGERICARGEEGNLGEEGNWAAEGTHMAWAAGVKVVLGLPLTITWSLASLAAHSHKHKHTQAKCIFIITSLYSYPKK